jgi:hypothetical protein
MNLTATKSVREHLYDHDEPNLVDEKKNVFKQGCLVNEKALEDGIIVTKKDNLKQLFQREKAKIDVKGKNETGPEFNTRKEQAADDLAKDIDTRITTKKEV